LIRRIFGIHSVSKNPWLRSLIATDYVLSLNAGDSFSDIYGLGDFIYVALPQVLAILLGKPIVQLPQTLGPFNSFASRHVAAFILRHSAKIFLRGEELVEEIRSLLPPSHRHKVCFCNDLAFVIHAKPFSRPDVESAFGSRPVIGFNVSGLIYSSACSGSNRFGLILDYRELVERSIAFFIDNAGANVILVPHFVGDGDFAACLEIYRGMEKAYRGRLFIARPSYDEGEIKSLIARCDFFVGARMHACIGALSQCVPAVAMAYSMKFIGVFSSVGVDGAVLDLRDTSLDQAIDLLRTQFESRAVLKSTLLERVPRAQRMVLEIVKGLDQLINPNASRVGRQ